ncbi:unnamed protein product, partial [Porites lobata]
KINKGPTAPKIVPKCMVLNARCLAKPDTVPALYTELSNNKIDTGRLLFEDYFVSESWLSMIILSHSNGPEGYITLRKDRAGSPIGGGVAIICRNDWKAKALNVTDSLEFES